MPGHEIDIDWHGRAGSAWLPDPLDGRPPELPAAVYRQAQQASEAARSVGALATVTWEPLARLLLRAEGVASSQLEDVRPPILDVMATELGFAVDDAATWVADNLAAMRAALADAATPLRVDGLHRWHRILMRHHQALHPGLIGSFRDGQEWISGTSPLDAAYVPPPAGEVPRLVLDLLRFVNREDVEPTVQAAVAHAQFEVIHPYADGNGRIGRVLVAWILLRRLGLPVPPPVSVMLARDRLGYVGGLSAYRLVGPAGWVRDFADALCRASEATDDLIGQVQRLVERWTGLLTGVRSHAASRRALLVLPAHPLISAAVLAQELRISDRAAREALAALTDRGIAREHSRAQGGPGRPAQLWIAPDLVDLVTSWSP